MEDCLVFYHRHFFSSGIRKSKNKLYVMVIIWKIVLSFIIVIFSLQVSVNPKIILHGDHMEDCLFNHRHFFSSGIRKSKNKLYFMVSIWKIVLSFSLMMAFVSMGIIDIRSVFHFRILFTIHLMEITYK